MSRFAHEHPDDPEGAWDALVDRADLDRKAARENAPSLTDEIFATVRAATKALYPEARIPETAMPTFTPGPWRLVYGDPFDHGEDGEANGFTVEMAEANAERRQVVHFVRYAEDVFPEDGGRAEAEANARLITAAPELHAALVDAIGIMPPEACGPALAALAKVRGDS